MEFTKIFIHHNDRFKPLQVEYYTTGSIVVYSVDLKYLLIKITHSIYSVSFSLIILRFWLQ